MKPFWPICIIFLSACHDATKEKSFDMGDTPAAKEVRIGKEEKPKQYEVHEASVPDYDTSVWTDIGLLNHSIVLDLKYATTDNFVGEKMYDCGRCFLRKEVAQQLDRAHKALQEKGYGLKMFDCYRPRPIQWKLWKKVPDRRYVADPEKGSMHNRGAAVDLTIVDAKGKELDMGTPYDFFGPQAHPSYTALPDTVLHHRKLLSKTMMQYGFRPTNTEWWHFSWNGQNYPLSDMLWECDKRKK